MNVGIENENGQLIFWNTYIGFSVQCEYGGEQSEHEAPQVLTPMQSSSSGNSDYKQEK
jgi:hypothetical protein